MTAAVPEQGQLVHVRNRRWSVLDVRPSSLPAPRRPPLVGSPNTSCNSARSMMMPTGRSSKSSGRSSREPTSRSRLRSCPIRGRASTTRTSSRPTSMLSSGERSANSTWTRRPKRAGSKHRSGAASNPGLPARPAGPGAPDAAGQPADRRRRGAGQDHRGRPGRPGARPPPPGPQDPDRLPRRPAGPVAGPDAGQVRARLPHPGSGDHERAAPGAGHPREPVGPLPPAHHLHGLPQDDAGPCTCSARPSVGPTGGCSRAGATC